MIDMTSMEDEKWVYWRMKAKMLEEENEQLKQQIKELKQNENLREIQITELRRLVNLATKNDFIKDSKKEKWRKELGFD